MPDDLTPIPVGIQLEASYSDSWGDGDRELDRVPVDQGMVTLAPVITQYTTDAHDTPIVGKTAPEGHFSEDGFGRWEHETNADPRWIYVDNLTDPRINPHVQSGATHRVTFRGLRARGRAVEITGGPVRITPDLIDPELGYVNLARLLPAPNATIVTVLGEEAITARAGAETARYGSEQARDESVAARDASREARDAAEGHRDDADASAADARSSAGGQHADDAEAARDVAQGAALAAGQHAEAVEGWHSETQSYRQAIRDAAQYMDTGWQDFVFTSSVYGPISWGEPPQWRVVNGVVYWRGIIERSSGAFESGHDPIDLNDQAAPLRDLAPDGSRHWVVGGQGNAIVRVRLLPGGEFGLHSPPIGYTTPSWISLEGISWPVSDDAAGMVPAELLLARDDATAAATAAEGYRDEAITAAEMASGLTGTGPPDFAAPPGTRYTDLDGTMGAWSWLKTSGTGRSGWTVVYGDTGWWDIAALSDQLEKHPSAGSFRMRRVNDEVLFEGRARPIQDGPLIGQSRNVAVALARVPLNWAPDNFTAHGYAITTAHRYRLNAVVNLGSRTRFDTAIEADTGSWSNGTAQADAVQWSARWQVTTSWPTSPPV